jgi:hypothetical protein
MPTAQQILADATATRDSLHRLETSINHEIDVINVAALSQPGNKLTAAQVALRDQMRAALSEVRSAFAELGFVTLVKLDNSVDVKNLLHDIAEANQSLDDDLSRLRTIETIAQEVADVAAQLPKVVAGLAQILPLL